MKLLSKKQMSLGYFFALGCIILSVLSAANGQSLPAPTGAIACGDRYVWVGTGEDVVRVDMVDGTAQRFGVPDFLASAPVLDILTTSEGSVWFRTPEGISHFDGDARESFTGENGLVSSTVNSFALDSTENIWVAAEGGISRYDGSQWESFIEVDGLILNTVADAVNGPNGMMWFYTRDGIARFDGDTWEGIAFRHNPIPRCIKEFDIDIHGVAWLCDDYYVYRYKEGEWSTFKLGNEGDDASYITFLACCYTGDIYVGTGGLFGGLFRYDDTDETWTQPFGYHLAQVYAATFDDTNTLWVNGEYALARITTDEYAHYVFPVDSFDSVGDVVDSADIASDDMGRIWLVHESGINQFNEGSWRLYPFDVSTRVRENENENQQFTIHANSPNPFNTATTISFSIPGTGNVTLSIYNVVGQKVRSFEKTIYRAGLHSVVWNGCDDEGNTVASGVYYLNLRFDDRQRTGTVLFMK